ncbi:hypothetical protein A2U01_0070165 [Trifolium medium]|uniref:Uncharacterized protein n=1 Tax=Trifolium medium TaxID=97028 RepID=A0A392SKF9_9FABA|nr:hypothetical protein [Trifolium medium]
MEEANEVVDEEVDADADNGDDTEVMETDGSENI